MESEITELLSTHKLILLHLHLNHLWLIKFLLGKEKKINKKKERTE